MKACKKHKRSRKTNVTHCKQKKTSVKFYIILSNFFSNYIPKLIYTVPKENLFVVVNHIMVLHFGVLRSQKVILMNHLCSAGLSAVSQEKKELSSSVTAPISIAISPPSSSIMDVLLCILRKIKFKKSMSTTVLFQYCISEN